MIIYVDYENTYETGLFGMEYLGEEDTIYVFYSNSVPNITKRFYQIAEEKNIEIKIRKLKEVKKNGLDFYIATQLGADIDSSQSYAIISKDTGYQAIKDYWEAVSPQKYTIHLGESIFDVLLGCQDERAAYLQEGREKIPVECFCRERILRDDNVYYGFPSPEVEEPEETLDDIIQTLSEYCDQVGLREAYAYAIETYGSEDGPEYYRQMKDQRAKKAKRALEEINLVGGDITKESVSTMVKKEKPEQNLIDEHSKKLKYGQVETMAIASAILVLGKDKLRITEISEFLNGSGEYIQFDSTPFRNYQGAFLGVKTSEISMEVRMFTKSDAIKVVDDIVYVIDKKILQCYAFPEPIRYQKRDPRENYHDIDWIAEIRSGEPIADDQWKWRYGLFQRPYLLLVYKDLIADLMKRAPLSCRTYVEKIYKREKNGFKKNSLQYILAKSKPKAVHAGDIMVG